MCVFHSSPLLGQPSKPSTKRSVVVDSAEDPSVGFGKGIVPGYDRVTRMKVKARSL